MIFYDFEVFEYDWLVVFKDLLNNEVVKIHNDVDKLTEFYEGNKDSLFIGFNNTRYDQFIFKGIMLGLRAFYVNDVIINGKQGRIHWLADWNSLPMYQYDVSMSVGFSSLKENEGYMGLSIEESSIPWDIGRPLTEKEIEDTFVYCEYDVDSTVKLFEKNMSNFQIKMELIRGFNLTKQDLSRSNVALVGKILGARKISDRGDELDAFDISSLPIDIKDRTTRDFFSKEIDYKVGATAILNQVPHVLGYGGLHGARSNFVYKGEMWLIDVSSYYPSMMIEYDYHSRGIPESKKKLFSNMKEERIHLKHTDPVKDEGYKLILNSTYGCLKYKYSPMYDPRMANNVCITGQLLLIDLIEDLEPYSELVQSNTDGILIIPNLKYEKEIMDIVKDWENRTKMRMEVIKSKQIFQKDVNNYILELEDGKIITKGGYVAQYNGGARKTLRVVDKAIVEHLVHGVDIATYINNETDIFEFQIMTKTGRTFLDTTWETPDGLKVINKVNRVYATKDRGYGRVHKRKANSRSLIPNCPTNCFVDNAGTEMTIDKIDKQWYIDMAEKRVRDYIG